MRGERRIGALAVGGAEIEVWKAAFEQTRDLAGDRVRVEDECIAVTRSEASELVCNARVVWLPDLGHEAGALLFAQALTFIERGNAVEQGIRMQSGRGRRVERRIVGRAIQIHCEAGVAGDEDRSAKLVDEVVEARKMPIRITERNAGWA